ncbi:hypothetical protein MA16_Dca006371 [Dendrobium catenatum]|uniref:Uncharacterized protein n=1 Tax=Dendrobium catenatum TaxID=906689 RepID=A0A2I0X7M3_9ASPA|nr:hypothetical protein MA16_Dca006371 [Dendrobium catenatum]
MKGGIIVEKKVIGHSPVKIKIKNEGMQLILCGGQLQQFRTILIENLDSFFFLLKQAENLDSFFFLLRQAENLDQLLKLTSLEPPRTKDEDWRRHHETLLGATFVIPSHKLPLTSSSLSLLSLPLLLALSGPDNS